MPVNHLFADQFTVLAAETDDVLMKISKTEYFMDPEAAEALAYQLLRAAKVSKERRKANKLTPEPFR